MEKVSFAVPRMYADHHVLAVRRALLEVPGVENVTASAMHQKVWVEIDAEKTSMEGLGQILSQAGYPPNEPAQLIDSVEPSKDGSSWYRFDIRTTETQRIDLEMSGDFRKY